MASASKRLLLSIKMSWVSAGSCSKWIWKPIRQRNPQRPSATSLAGLATHSHQPRKPRHPRNLVPTLCVGTQVRPLCGPKSKAGTHTPVSRRGAGEERGGPEVAQGLLDALCFPGYHLPRYFHWRCTLGPRGGPEETGPHPQKRDFTGMIVSSNATQGRDSLPTLSSPRC